MKSHMTGTIQRGVYEWEIGISVLLRSGQNGQSSECLGNPTGNLANLKTWM